jgi:hypothetical protein
MNDPFNRLRETIWRRKLSPSEETELRSKVPENPEARRDLEADIVLTRELNRLPDAPVPSNFTALVIQAIKAENVKAARSGTFNWKWFLHSLLPKSAFAMLLVMAGLFSLNEARAAKRAQLARSVAAVSQVASLPGPDVLKDFDAIQHLNSAPPPDTELLALLK